MKPGRQNDKGNPSASGSLARTELGHSNEQQKLPAIRKKLRGTSSKSARVSPTKNTGNKGPEKSAPEDRFKTVTIDRVGEPETASCRRRGRASLLAGIKGKGTNSH